VALRARASTERGEEGATRRRGRGTRAVLPLHVAARPDAARADVEPSMEDDMLMLMLN
jgi:hypothetical protein